MWKVTVDSNVPIKGPQSTDVPKERRDSHPRRPRSPLRSASPVRSRPPPPGKTSTVSSSRSQSPSPRRSTSNGSMGGRAKHYWNTEWTKALDNAVDDLEDSKARHLNTSLDGSLHQAHTGLYDSPRGRGPVKAIYDRSLPALDSESGFGNGFLTAEDVRATLSKPLVRSGSMSRLNGSFTGDSMPFHGTPSIRSTDHLLNRSVHELQHSLEDSEARRNVLVHKLKEAQATLELQTGRLSKIENSAKENNGLVEGLKLKEREHRTKISQLEHSEEEKQRLQVENLRLREEMQNRISGLDYQLKSLKTQHRSTECDNDKRNNLLEHTSAALSLLEEENSRLQQEKEKLQNEVHLMKDAFGMTKSRFGTLDEDNRSLKAESGRTREDNQALTRKVQEMAGQMIELRSLLQALKDENERMSSTHRSTSDDKSRTTRQIESYQETITDVKARLAATGADRDRLFTEKLEMSGKIQQMVLDKEKMMRENLNLEDQISERSSQRSYSKHYETKAEQERKEIDKELSSVKKVSRELSQELASVKGFYESALEQVSMLEGSKVMWQQQQDLVEAERRRMQGEMDRLGQALSNRGQEDKRDLEHKDDQIYSLRSELKQTKFHQTESENKIDELEAKLNKANEGIREGTVLQHSELDQWKQTCERLTSSVSRKESELQNFTDRCAELEDTISGLRQEMRCVKDRSDTLTDVEEDVKRLKEENRRLLQEKAENEQMMKLLETQKQVLSRNSEDSLEQLGELEQLSAQMDTLRHENMIMRERALELEKSRNTLMQQKEDALESEFRSPTLEELEVKMEEVRDTNRQLREVNEVMSLKLEAMNQECTNLKQQIESSASKAEADRLQGELSQTQTELNNLKHEHGLLDAKHQRFIINYGHDGEMNVKGKEELIKIRKEKDAMQKQVTLLQGQITLMEGSKKRSDEQISKLTFELEEVKAMAEHNMNGVANGDRSAEEESLKPEVESLRKQLASAKENQKIQEKMMKNLREDVHEERAKKPRQIQESLEDVSQELQHMRAKLQQLMAEIQGKEQTIDSLEAELRDSREAGSLSARDKDEMSSLVHRLQEENSDLRQNLEHIRNSLAADMAQEQEDQALRRSKSEKSLQDELTEALKTKQEGMPYGRSRTPTAFLSKSLTQLEQRPSSCPPQGFDPVPNKPATDGSDRLQSLISKYRSHSENTSPQPQQHQQHQQQQPQSPRQLTKPVKPIPGFVASKIVSKNRFGGGRTTPKAPMRQTSDPDNTPISPLAKQDGDSPTPIMSSRPHKKLPPPPPPKPTASSLLSAKSSLIRTIAIDNVHSKSDTPTSLTTPTRLSSTFPASSPAHSATPLSSTSTNSLSSSGLGASVSSADGLNDSTDQKDINTLIQKMSLFDDMASF